MGREKRTRNDVVRCRVGAIAGSVREGRVRVRERPTALRFLPDHSSLGSAPSCLLLLPSSPPSQHRASTSLSRLPSPFQPLTHSTAARFTFSTTSTRTCTQTSMNSPNVRGTPLFCGARPTLNDQCLLWTRKEQCSLLPQTTYT